MYACIQMAAPINYKRVAMKEATTYSCTKISSLHLQSSHPPTFFLKYSNSLSILYLPSTQQFFNIHFFYFHHPFCLHHNHFSGKLINSVSRPFVNVGIITVSPCPLLHHTTEWQLRDGKRQGRQRTRRRLNGKFCWSNLE